MSIPAASALNRLCTPPLLPREHLLERFPECEEIKNFSDIQCDSMLSLVDVLDDDPSRIVLAISRDLADYGPNLFLDLTTHMNRYKDQFNQIFERIFSEQFSLPQSLFLAKFSDLNFAEYFDKIKGLSHETCLEGINNPTWCKVVLAYNKRGHDFYLRIDDLSNLIALSVIQCQVSEKIAAHRYYENQFDVCDQVKGLSDEDGQWTLDIIAYLERENQWDKVINFMSEEVPLHQALVLVRFVEDENEVNHRRGEVQSLYLFECMRLAELLADGSSFDEAIFQVIRSKESSIPNWCA